MSTPKLTNETDAIGDMMENIDGFEVQNVADREALLLQLNRNHKELERRQRKYKKTINLRYKSRKDTIIEKSYLQTAERLRQERNDLRAQIWVADGITHIKDNDNYLRTIQCHVKCQDRLAKLIKILKKDIMNMERGIQNQNKQIYELNLKTVPDSQYQAHVATERKKLALLENRLEVGIRQESVFTSMNASMREKINNIIYDRKRFYSAYTKMMQSLTSDKKYLIEIMEYAIGVFESCIDVHDKIEMVNRRHQKENDARKIEAQSIMRHQAAMQEAEEFLFRKCQSRALKEMQPKELRRRETFKHDHEHKIHLYAKVLCKLLKYYGAADVGEVTDRFQQQESLYYSYFSYANEMGYHVTLLNNTVNRLYNDVEALRSNEKTSISSQINTIGRLEEELKEKKLRNSELAAKRDEKEMALKRYYSGLNEIVRACKLNIGPLLELLGDHTSIDLENVKHFTKLLEGRVIRIVANVYCDERKRGIIQPDDQTVKHCEKLFEPPTDIRDVVLTQQCPECAEGEAFNMDEMADNGVHVHTVAEAKQNLVEKVNQPEMQYRLHNISQCRLPRSRFLAAKRNAP